jgi:hypothetical protein
MKEREEHIEYNAWELDFDVHEIDWEQRRFELVKAAMQGMMSSNLSTQEIVWQSIEMADAIIKGLKSEVELPGTTNAPKGGSDETI